MKAIGVISIAWIAAMQGMAGVCLAQVGSITVDFLESGPRDIPREGTLDLSFTVTGLPPDSQVDKVCYEITIDDRGAELDFWVSDYEYSIGSDIIGKQGWKIPSGGKTDAGSDDDPEDDSDYEHSWLFTGWPNQNPNDTWHIWITDVDDHGWPFHGYRKGDQGKAYDMA
jgi:hypothetical protein